MTKVLYIYNIQNHLARKKFWEKGLVNFSSLLLSAAQCADGVLSTWQAGKRKPQLRKGLHLWEGLAHCGLQFLPPGSSPDFPLQHYRWTVICDSPHVAFDQCFITAIKSRLLCAYYVCIHLLALELIGFPVFTLTLLNVLSRSICFHI